MAGARDHERDRARAALGLGDARRQHELAGDRPLDRLALGLLGDLQAQRRREPRDDDAARDLGRGAEVVGDDGTQRLAADLSACGLDRAGERGRGERADLTTAEEHDDRLQAARGGDRERGATGAAERARPRQELDRRGGGRRGRRRAGVTHVTVTDFEAEAVWPSESVATAP